MQRDNLQQQLREARARSRVGPGCLTGGERARSLRGRGATRTQAMTSRVPLRALVLEDSEFDGKVMVQALRKGGYEVQWRRVETAAAMEQALRDQAWDIVLADYNMPEFNAPQALKILQDACIDVPFIIVSGGIGEDVAVAAMKAGAHDYVMKGNPARLLPAVDRELREAAVRRGRREAEAQLRESELRYRSLWETSPDAVLVCDETGRIGFANPAAEVVFGFGAHELAGLDLARLEPVVPVGPAGVNTMGGGLRRALAMAGASPALASGGGAGTGMPLVGEGIPSQPAAGGVGGVLGGARALVEGPALRKDGQAIVVEVASSRFDLPDRPWFVLFARDITEKRRNEADLRAREEQMRAAREIQQRLFPKAAPMVPGYDIAGTSVPADATGGDYYDFLPMLDGHIGLVVADVSGHGLGPSLLMVETRALLRVVARNRIDPGEILARANRVITEDVEGRSYVTLLLVRFNPATGELVHASAGHPPAFVLGADGTIKAQLRRTGGPLGFVRGHPPTSAPSIRLVPGDVLVLYTDGIKEARRGSEAGEEGEEFGMERMADVVRANAGRPAQEIMTALCQAAVAYSAPSPLEDDLTLLIVKAL